MLGDRTWREPPTTAGLAPARRVKFRFASAPVTGPEAAPRCRAHPPRDVAGVRATGNPLPAGGVAAATDLAVLAAVARFEHQAGMGSAEFAQRYRRGEFGHPTWARVWFGLLQ